MREKDRILLKKMAAHTQEILSYIKDMDFKTFLSDKKSVNASAFLIGQIGELASQISNETQNNYSDIPWRNIKGMRNRIIHDYENVDFTVLWGTITESLPELLNIISKVLENS
ncbi:MAG: DUF86 domain-containing protein [Leptospirales bacterium]|nr:DUF86 domain-containing protein [Leptospirales bacterium]